MKITNELILTAGPSITNKEIEYIMDAAINGWNHKHSDYIKKFENAFAEYIGVKYALATSSCTGALHLALAGMGVGVGDEVIIPETSWIATASAVTYVGAIPVFVDIDEDTWVMDAKKIEKLITNKTKVIIPVHLYGNPVDMEPLLELARNYGLKVLEDAAPSIGALYNNKKTGSFGDAAAVSFQGAKALVTGEGGMFVTNDEDLYNRVKLLWDHGRDPVNPLSSIKEIGYKYKMSNIQAALGLAQIERVEEIVEKKRTIFNWYYERLKNIKTLKMNYEKPGTRNIYWMTSIILDNSISITRDDFIEKMKERNIDTRPFFSPISSFPMFKSMKAINPVAYNVPLRGINLPSGHNLMEEEIDYVCENIKDILGLETNSLYQPKGWLAFRDNVDNMLNEYKKAQDSDISNYCIPLTENGYYKGRLRPITYESLKNDEDIAMLARWRKDAQEWFPSQFNVTIDGTRKWLEEAVLQTKDRILFWVEDNNGKPIGHVGLYRFDYRENFCEIDNIVRGEKGVFANAMYLACSTLIDWTIKNLKVQDLYLRVVSDNAKALALYDKLNFIEIQRIPLLKFKEEEVIRWVELIGQPYYETYRYLVTMKLKKK